MSLHVAVDTAATEQDLATLRRRIHAAIDGDVVVVAGFMATWARHDSKPSSPGDGRAMMRCPFPGHEDPRAACAVSTADGDPVVRFECRVCGTSGNVVTAHQMIFGSDIPQAMRAVWVALAGALWLHSPVWRPGDNPHHLNSIIEAASVVCGVPAAQITGHSRTRDHVEARQLAMHVGRAATGLSYPELGREFGGRDHTTVISGVRRIERLVTERPDLCTKLRAIEAWVHQPPVEPEVQR